jgi:hypothetical protein
LNARQAAHLADPETGSGSSSKGRVVFTVKRQTSGSIATFDVCAASATSRRYE